MTFPDDSRDEPGKGPPDGQTEPDLPFDEDAAWNAIVANYGARPRLVEPVETTGPVETNPFDRSYLDAVDEQSAQNARARDSWADEGHFVPPEPPPLPHPTPARRLAWIGLFGAPVMMLLAVIGHWSYPSWVSMGLVAAFVGGFVFLVATMERQHDDGWGGDDGAVV
jgi:hypothetical protein